MDNTRLNRRLLGMVIPVFLLVAWEAIWHVQALRMDSLSHPWDVARALYLGLMDTSILKSTLETLEAAALGFGLAALCGLFMGIVLGLMPRVERMVGPTVDAMRPVPSVALIPLALLLFGFGVSLEALVVAFASFWPVLLVTTAAVRAIDPRLLEVADALEMSSLARTYKIVIPAALGMIAVGLQLALGIALIVAVTVEIVINPRGLGFAMMSSQQALRFDEMYAQLLWIGLIGWGISKLSQRLVQSWPGMAVQGAAA
ncbi:ABC transporter permease [Polaromonas sp.]|uniref:ABC transporter permease n=1 Tax=Polaromonas sp. TaxID=1869339 RepID=UPI003BABFC48